MRHVAEADFGAAERSQAFSLKTVAEPAVGRSRPSAHLMSVVLPLPFEPKQTEHGAGLDRQVDAAEDLFGGEALL